VDPRGALWEKRLHWPVLAAAWLAIPTVILYFSKLGDTMAAVALTMAWSIWAVFLIEAAIMISVVRDRMGWVRGHLFGLAIVLVTFPLLTNILEGLLAARALSSLQAVRILQVLYLAKALKVIKSVLIVQKKGGTRMHPALTSALALLSATVIVGIGHRIATGEKKTTPFHSAWDVLDDLPPWSAAVIAIGLAAAVAATLAIRARRSLDET
jgi:hypothetical protein